MNVAPKTQPGTFDARPAAGQAFWDVGGGGFAGQTMAPDHEFSELVEVNPSRRAGPNALLYALLLLVIAVVGWFAFEMFVAERDPVATLAGYIDLLTDGDEPAVELPAAPRKPPRPAKPVAVQPPPALPSVAVAGNPYWTLPNKILGHSRPLQRPWAPEEEEALRAGLAHHFAYQRYKTVMEIRERRLLGSDAVLWDALQDKKFWTRMFAAVGLAEFNIEISLQSLEAALAGARSELIADFFERFVHRPSAPQLFVMRQVIRLLDEKGRLVVLQAIGRSHDALRDLYVVAATQDPGPKVQTWAQRTLASRPVPEPRLSEMRRVVRGTVDGGYLLLGSKGAAPAAPAKPPIVTATEQDLEKELQEFQDADGNVEFYDDVLAGDDEAAIDDEADPDTFEYEE